LKYTKCPSVIWERTLKTVRGLPPNFAEIRKVLHPGPRTLFTYGDTVYLPPGVELSPELEAHELVHKKQQGDRVEEWWRSYLASASFRLRMEVPAHQAEYNQFIERNPNRRNRRFMIKALASRLSGPLYGRVISFSDAKRLILSGEEIK